MRKLDSGSSLAVSLLVTVTALFQLLEGGQAGRWHSEFRFEEMLVQVQMGGYIYRNEFCESRGGWIATERIIHQHMSTHRWASYHASPP